MGRPGLVGTVARTAVISGTASAVSNNVSRRQSARAQQSQAAAQHEQQQWDQQQQWAAQQAAAPPPTPYAPAAAEPAPAGSGDATIDKLKELADLKAQGILTDDEFAEQKARILAG